MAPRRLGECSGAAEERWDAKLSACGVVPVDEVTERVERQVLGEREGQRKAAWVRPQPATELVEGKSEEAPLAACRAKPARRQCGPRVTALPNTAMSE